MGLGQFWCSQTRRPFRRARAYDTFESNRLRYLPSVLESRLGAIRLSGRLLRPPQDYHRKNLSRAAKYDCQTHFLALFRTGQSQYAETRTSAPILYRFKHLS